MKKFEYKTVEIEKLEGRFSQYVDVSTLNTFGNEGWELTAVIGRKAIFKREREDEPSLK